MSSNHDSCYGFVQNFAVKVRGESCQSRYPVKDWREMNPTGLGRLVIISGPSGAGKSTVLRRLEQACPLPIRRSISATTRAPRPGEKDAEDYFFLTHEQFQQRRANNEFLECEEVFSRGDWYGTLHTEVEAGLQAGQWLILEIDVGGALKVMELRRDAISIFLHPGSLEALRERLESRGTETEDSLQRRLATARREMQVKDRYQYEVINDFPDRAAEVICRILTENRQTGETGAS